MHTSVQASHGGVHAARSTRRRVTGLAAVTAFSLRDGANDASWVTPNTGLPPARAAEVCVVVPGLCGNASSGATTLEQLIDEMDEAGVAKALLCSGYGGADNIDWVRKAVASYPDRFASSAVVDPRKGMAAVRLVEALTHNDGCRLVRMLAPRDGDPLQRRSRTTRSSAKCAELGVPVGLNVGIPGPMVPAKYQASLGGRRGMRLLP